MDVPIQESMATQNAPVTIRLEERTRADFDLSGDRKYVDLKEITGRLVLDFEANRGELLEIVERAKSPGMKDRFNMLLEDWSLQPDQIDELDLDFGTLVLEGTEPLGDLDDRIPLEKTISVEDLQENSPGDLRRMLRDEITYETTHEKLIEDIRNYFEREGVNAEDAEFSEPFQIQAQAEAVGDGSDAATTGTEFTIKISNNRAKGPSPPSTGVSRIWVSMPPEIGREVQPPEPEDGYDPADEMYEFRVGEIKRGEEAEVSFLVPVSAGRDLELLEGEVEISMRKPFTYLNPSTAFDAGGKKVGAGGGQVDIESGGIFEAEFSAPTSEILKEEAAEITKKVMIKGITPDIAEDEVEGILSGRGVNAEYSGLEESADMREGDEVTTFNGRWRNGSVLVEDTRISIDIWIEGERRSGEVSAEVEEGERLPAQQRNVSMSYGRTGIRIRGHGADSAKVDEYVSDLRDEIRLTLENRAVEV